MTEHAERAEITEQTEILSDFSVSSVISPLPITTKPFGEVNE
jgi:hypothetical protein